MDPHHQAILGRDPKPFKPPILISDLMTSLSSIDPQILAILGPNPIHFETLISDLMTSSKEQRSQAESLYKSCETNYCDDLAIKLVNLLEHSPHLEVRAMSAILLPDSFRQYYSSDYERLFESTQSRVKSGLLNCVVNEQNKPIIKILGNTISKFVAENGWPELMPLMFDHVASEDSRLQESALLIFAQLPEYVGYILVPHITHFHDVFMNCLSNVGSADVWIAALSAAINFIQYLKSSSARDTFQDLLPCMMECLSEALKDGNEAMAQKALVLLIELAGTEPSFFEGLLVEVVEGMLQIAEAESLEEGTRHLSIEFVVTLAEARGQASGIMRKLLEFISRLFVILMRMLLDIEDEAAWHSAESDEDDEDEDAGESSSYSVGQECLYRLAVALGGDIVPVAYDHEQLHAYLAAPDREWQKHLAALIALAQIAKGSSKVEIPNLEQVVTIVLKSFKDPHPRVRWAAINAIEHLYTYVGPSLQDQYHDRVLQAIYLALDDVKNPRVQARAVSALLHVSSHSPNLDGIILNKLIVLPLTSPIIQVLKLANLLEESTDVQIRASSAVLLGKMFEKPLVVLTLDLVQRKLLTCVEKEDNRIVMKSLCHTIATFFNELCIKIGWPELISSVERWALGDNDLLKEAAMLILGSLRDFTKNHFISLKVYYACLENASTDIKIAAFRAAIGYNVYTGVVADMGVDLVLSMRRVLTEGLNEGKEETTQEALKLLIERAHQIKHRFLELSSMVYDTSREYFLDYLVRSAVEIAKSQSLKKETRHLAIDFVITSVEEMRAYISGVDIDVNRLFEILMLMLSDIENEAASHSAENEGDDAWESRNYSVLRTFLDRLVRKLHGKFVPWLVLEQYLAAYEWQKRVAAIVALAQISKVLKVTKKIFDQLVTKVLVLFQDSQPRVRLAAINATGQLSSALDPDLWLQYHHLVLPALAKAIYDFQYPPVQAHAASAVVDISKNIPPDTLTPYLLEIVGTLLKFWRQHDIASDQIHAIKNLLKQFRAKLQPDAWASTWSSLFLHQQSEFISIVAL